MNAAKGKKVRTCFSSGVVKWPELEVVKNMGGRPLKFWHSVSTKRIIHHYEKIARSRGINACRLTIIVS